MTYWETEICTETTEYKDIKLVEIEWREGNSTSGKLPGGPRYQELNSGTHRSEVNHPMHPMCESNKDREERDQNCLAFSPIIGSNPEQSTLEYSKSNDSPNGSDQGVAGYQM